MTTANPVLELACSVCGRKFNASTEQHLCTCGQPLFAQYGLKKAAATLSLKNLPGRVRTLWRYAEVLPDGAAVTLGEGMTALLATPRLGAAIGLERLYVKDEGLNPT